MVQDQQTYNIGIVGCGDISDTHAQAVLKIEKGNLIAAFSRTESAVEEFGTKYDIKSYTSYKKFLSNPALDIVAICTPTGTHLEYGQQAAEAGKHLIIEKPIEVTVDRGKTLIETCQHNKVNLAIIYQSRFIPEVIQLKKYIEDQTIGDIIMASASVKWYRDQEYYNNSSWRGTFALDGGGAVINQSIHTIDLLQWFAGRVESISAFNGAFTHDGMEAEDNAVACLKFRNGALGVFQASTSITPPQEREIEINGTKGTLLLKGNDLHKRLSDHSESDVQSKSEDAAGASSPLSGMTYQNHKKQYNAILEAFHNNTTPVVSGKESLQSLAIVEALYQAGTEQKVIQIEDILS